MQWWNKSSGAKLQITHLVEHFVWRQTWPEKWFYTYLSEGVLVWPVGERCWKTQDWKVSDKEVWGRAEDSLRRHLRPGGHLPEEALQFPVICWINYLTSMYIQVLIFEIIFYIITIHNVIVKETIHNYLLECFLFSFLKTHAKSVWRW